jgi:hypothetical protein
MPTVAVHSPFDRDPETSSIAPNTSVPSGTSSRASALATAESSEILAVTDTLTVPGPVAIDAGEAPTPDTVGAAFGTSSYTAVNVPPPAGAAT